MTGPRTTPCNWPLAYCGDSQESNGVTDFTQCSSLAGLSPAMAQLIQEAAVSYLWNWTRRQFGTCPVTIRPCRDTCWEAFTVYRGRSSNNYLPYTDGGYDGPFQPALINGQWFNFGCGGACNTDVCSCTYVPTITLAGPVASISQVRIGGEVLPPTHYRLDNHSYLIRTDGNDWPVCQDMKSDPSVLGSDSFEVTYDLGVEVPAGGQLAAGVLACQMAKAACGDKSCQLPQRLQSLSRQGVVTTVMDSYGSLYEYGTTGLWVVDNWVASIMASNRQAGMRIASPDRRPTRKTTS